jgi:hypothetical protein
MYGGITDATSKQRAWGRGFSSLSSDGDWHVTLPREGCLGSMSRREHAVMRLAGSTSEFGREPAQLTPDDASLMTVVA